MYLDITLKINQNNHQKKKSSNNNKIRLNRTNEENIQQNSKTKKKKKKMKKKNLLFKFITYSIYYIKIICNFIFPKKTIWKEILLWQGDSSILPSFKKKKKK